MKDKSNLPRESLEKILEGKPVETKFSEHAVEINSNGFLETIYGGINRECFTNIFARPSAHLAKSAERVYSKTIWFQVSAFDAMIKQAKILNDQGYEVSFLAGAVTEDTYKELRKNGSRGKEEDVAFVRCLKADIDVYHVDSEGNPIHRQGEKLAPNFEKAREIIPPELMPSFIINSGFGIHAYWILDAPLDLRDHAQRKIFEEMNRDLRAILAENPDCYYIDEKFKASDVLRCPETHNLKLWNGENIQDQNIAKIIESSRILYKREDLESILKKLRPKLQVSTNPREISESQREAVDARRYVASDGNAQCVNEKIREILDRSEKLSRIYQKCVAIRAIINNPQNLSHDRAKHLFPSLLRFNNEEIEFGRELCVELCKQWFGSKFSEAKTNRQLDGLATINNSCEAIHKSQGIPCAFSQCEIYKCGGRCPAAILGKKFSNANGISIGKIFPDAPAEIRELLIPSGYEISELQVVDIRGKKEKICINSPVVVSKEIIDADTGNPKYYEIMRYREGRWRSCRVEPVVINDSKLATQTLSKFGINIPSRRAGYATEYLTDFFKVNSSRVKSVTVYSKLGWHNDQFILPTLNDGSYEIVDSTFVRKIKRKGNYHDSLELIKEASKYRYVRLLIDANLAAPLVEIVGCRNFVLDLVSGSHQGKSTAMVLANSIWGVPKLMANFNATPNAVEEIAADRNSLPSNINEWQMTDSKNRDEIANQIIHRFSEGEGRARLNRDGSQKPTRSWNGILIITSEAPLTNYETFQGVKTRCWEVFADTIINDQKFCKKIWDITKFSYGHLGPEFILKLQDEFSDDQDHKKIREEFNFFFQKALEAKTQKIIASYAEYVAILACAHFRFNKMFLEMNESDALNDTLYFIKRESEAMPTENEMLDTVRAKEAILEWAHSYGSHFCRFNSKANAVEDTPIKDPYYGFYDKEGLNVIPDALKEALRKRGFNPNKIIREWAEKSGDIVKSNEKDRFTKKKTDPKFGGRRNFIVLTLPKDESIDNEEQIDPNSNPF